MITNEVQLHQNKIWTVICPDCKFEMIIKHGHSEKCECDVLWSVVYYGHGIPYVEEEVKGEVD